MIINRGESVATVPEEEIDAIRRTVEGQFRVEPHPFLRCGERVRVVRGSMEGVEGVLIRKKNLYRLVLSVDMLAQSVAVEIDALDVIPVQRNIVAFYPHGRQQQDACGAPRWRETEESAAVERFGFIRLAESSNRACFVFSQFTR